MTHRQTMLYAPRHTVADDGRTVIINPNLADTMPLMPMFRGKFNAACSRIRFEVAALEVLAHAVAGVL